MELVNSKVEKFGLGSLKLTLKNNVLANGTIVFKEQHFCKFAGEIHYLGFGHLKLKATH